MKRLYAIMISVVLLGAFSASAQEQHPTAFVPLAPVQLVQPNGRVKGYGLGAATDAARATALRNAVSASSAGDKVIASADCVGDGPFEKLGVPKPQLSVTSSNASVPVLR